MSIVLDALNRRYQSHNHHIHKKKNCLKAVFLIASLTVGAANASEVWEAFDWALKTQLESRYFWQAPLWPGQTDGDFLSVSVEPSVRWRSDDGRYRAGLVIFGRKDELDGHRTHGDVREAYWNVFFDRTDILLGINKVFWGVTESRHLVDVINQTDNLEDIDGEDKLGQFMLNLNHEFDWGRVSLFLLPHFRERDFPGVRGRFRAPVQVNVNEALYESAQAEKHLDWAFRYSHYFGPVDLGLSYFDGTNREPRLVGGVPGPYLKPVYDLIKQFSVDAQLTLDAWLWKLEVIYQDAPLDNFLASVAGVEYTFYQVWQSDADLGVLVEWQRDHRNAFQPVTLADRDLFGGVRLAMNDAQDASVLGGFTWDTQTKTLFYNLEAERRFLDFLVVEMRLRIIGHVDAVRSDAAVFFERDDYFQISCSAYF